MLKSVIDGALLVAVAITLVISYNSHGGPGYLGEYGVEIIGYCITIAVMLIVNVNRKITYTLAAPLFIVVVLFSIIWIRDGE